MNDLEFLKLIDRNPQKVFGLLNQELSLPNIPMKTMGGEVWWTNLAEYNGWRLQQNMVTHHARILDPDDVRRAWGTYNGMRTAMDRIIRSFKDKEASSSDKEMAYERLKELDDLWKRGILSDQEYEEKKKKYIDML